jgi:hypothetical protein
MKNLKYITKNVVGEGIIVNVGTVKGFSSEEVVDNCSTISYLSICKKRSQYTHRERLYEIQY